MPSSLPQQLTVEKTPSYFVTRSAPERIYKLNPNTKILLVVRDPVTRAMSEYAQVSAKRPDIGSFDSVAFQVGQDGQTTINEKWGAVKLGLYWMILRRWLAYFPLRNIMVVSGERLISHPAQEMKQVEDFLGLKNVITSDHFYYNETKGFPCLKKGIHGSEPHCLGHTKGRAHPTLSADSLKLLREYYAPHNEIFSRLVNRHFNWPV